MYAWNTYRGTVTIFFGLQLAVDLADIVIQAMHDKSVMHALFFAVGCNWQLVRPEVTGMSTVQR